MKGHDRESKENAYASVVAYALAHDGLEGKLAFIEHDDDVWFPVADGAVAMLGQQAVDTTPVTSDVDVPRPPTR